METKLFDEILGRLSVDMGRPLTEPEKLVVAAIQIKKEHEALLKLVVEAVDLVAGFRVCPITGGLVNDFYPNPENFVIAVKAFMLDAELRVVPIDPFCGIRNIKTDA